MFGFRLRFIFPSFVFIDFMPMIISTNSHFIYIFVIDIVLFFGIKYKFPSFTNYNYFFHILWIVYVLELWLKLWIIHLLSKSHFMCFIIMFTPKKIMVTSIEEILLHLDTCNKKVNHYINPLFISKVCKCYNPNLGLVTKARACKGVGQEGSSRVTSHVLGSVGECEGMNPHTPK